MQPLELELNRDVSEHRCAALLATTSGVVSIVGDFAAAGEAIELQTGTLLRVKLRGPALSVRLGSEILESGLDQLTLELWPDGDGELYAEGQHLVLLDGGAWRSGHGEPGFGAITIATASYFASLDLLETHALGPRSRLSALAATRQAA